MSIAVLVQMTLAAWSASWLAHSQWFSVENSCAAYKFGVGVIEGYTDPCTDGISLTTSTDRSCTVKCAPGYTGDATTVTCASDAADGAAATSSISCSGDGKIHETVCWLLVGENSNCVHVSFIAC